MGRSDPVSVVRGYIQAFNQGDLQRFKESLAPNAVYREYATSREVHGADEFTAVAAAWRDAFPDISGEITDAFSSGDQVTAQIVWTGTQSGALAGPTGTIPATGNQIRVNGCQVVRTNNDQVAATDHYFDLLTMLSQLGVAPG